ncbi:MAG: hypothetical protein ACRC0V_06640 [Fusobacteriaceae bacterium]
MVLLLDSENDTDKLKKIKANSKTFMIDRQRKFEGSQSERIRYILDKV